MGIYVVFFGGFNSYQQDMDLWTNSAENQRDDVKFDAFPYPEHVDSSRAGAVGGFGDKFDDVIDGIKETDAETLFIVGHSSGCAIANEANSRVEGDHTGITLVDLDGFSPLHPQIKGSKVEVWSAEGGGGTSLNWAKGHKI